MHITLINIIYTRKRNQILPITTEPKVNTRVLKSRVDVATSPLDAKEIRTLAPEGNSLAGCRVNHSAIAPCSLRGSNAYLNLCMMLLVLKTLKLRSASKRGSGGGFWVFRREDLEGRKKASESLKFWFSQIKWSIWVSERKGDCPLLAPHNFSAAMRNPGKTVSYWRMANPR